MQSINFGRIDGLQIRRRHPVFEPMPTIRREYKFGSNNGTMRPAEDFQLKRQVCELLDQFDVIVDGTIDQLDIKHGLPFRMIVSEFRGTLGKECN
jgi:hypothetical protein